MASYVPGERVWVYIEGDGWWPARVLSDAEVGTRTPGQDIAVQFYAGIDTPASLYELNSHGDAGHICYFETSSEKAVTGNPELEASIRHASEDTEAKPLKTAATSGVHTLSLNAGANAGAGHRAAQASAAAAANKATFKRVRDAEDDGTHLLEGAPADPHFQRMRNAELTKLSQDIAEAVAAKDVAKVRTELCSLEGVDVNLQELDRTKIGVSVGSVLGEPALKPMWPLARAIVSFWARHLPVDTLAAIRSVQQQQEGPSTATVAEPGSPMEPSSPLGGTQMRPATQAGSPGPSSGSAFANLPTSPAAAGATTTTSAFSAPSPTRPSATSSSRRSFYDHVRQLLDNPQNTKRYEDSVYEDVARKLAAEITDADERHMLLVRLREEELEFVRDNLLSGEWTPKKYLDQPDEVFTTRSEKAKQEQRVQEKIKAVEAAQNAGLNVTALFKCERCGQRNCTFYEQQTRGADEPTTKYITCLNCKLAWSQE